MKPREMPHKHLSAVNVSISMIVMLIVVYFVAVYP